MKKFTGFTKEHVGCKVMDIISGRKGTIGGYSESNKIYNVIVRFGSCSVSYTPGGLFSDDNKERRLYFGHDAVLKVTGEEVPEPKLICPVCKVEHYISKAELSDCPYFFFSNVTDLCPMVPARFSSKERANKAMQNLITAMEAK